MVRVGLSGGIGSGKSEVARRLAELGAVVIDADAIAREVVDIGTPGLSAIIAEFGPGILTADGALDRPAMAAIVFRDAARRGALEAIVHPLIAARSRELEAAAPAGSIVVHDQPLLVERFQPGTFDVIVIVDAPDEVRIRRLAGRGIAPDEANRRMAAQASREQRLAIADYVIDNGGDLSALGAQVKGLWSQLTAAPKTLPTAAESRPEAQG